MEIPHPGGAAAGGVGATAHPREMPPRETPVQGTDLGTAPEHGMHSSHMGPGTSPNRPRRVPTVMPTRPRQRRRLRAARRSGALPADLFPCKSTLI